MDTVIPQLLLSSNVKLLLLYLLKRMVFTRYKTYRESSRYIFEPPKITRISSKVEQVTLYSFCLLLVTGRPPLLYPASDASSVTN